MRGCSAESILTDTYKETRNIRSRIGVSGKVTGTAQDWKPGVFWEARIGFRQPAKQESRALCGVDCPRVLAIVAQTKNLPVWVA
jgi:hypothetical protein